MASPICVEKAANGGYIMTDIEVSFNNKEIGMDLEQVFEYLLFHFEGRSQSLTGPQFGKVAIERGKAKKKARPNDE